MKQGLQSKELGGNCSFREFLENLCLPLVWNALREASKFFVNISLGGLRVSGDGVERHLSSEG